MKKILLIAALLLAVTGCGLYVGSSYATKTVHDQLSAQKIFFPKDEASGLFPDLTKYAGQQVDNGEEAQVYADKFIARHIEKAGGGKTYSEVSAEFLKNPTDTKLAQTRQTLFMGETLRGLLLNAWGWGLIGSIAMCAAYGVLAMAAVLAVCAFAFSGKSTRGKKRRK